MNTCLFNMFHDTPDKNLLTIADSINIEFNGILEIGIDQHRVVLTDPDCLLHIGLEFLLIVNDLHCPPSKDIRWPDQHRIPDLRSHGTGISFRISRTVCRAWNIEFMQE